MDDLNTLDLQVLDHVPAGFLDADPDELADLLGGPTLIHLPGRRSPELFISALLHGNEHTGLRAVQKLLRDWAGRTLPRALTVFIGNVSAARLGLRRLDGQPDFNRIWPGTDEDEGPEVALARAVTERMRARGVFACVDVHNNTGLNPHYACVSSLDAQTLQLAALFSRIAVFFHTPHGVASGAFAQFAPAIAVECGKSDDPANDARAAEFLEACLHLSDLPSHPVAAHDLALYRTVCVVKVADGVDFAFAPAKAPLTFEAGLDHMNFTELEAGALLGRIADDAPARMPLRATDDDGRDVTDSVLELGADRRLRLRAPLMPAMITLDLRVIRQDCLCYLMERMASTREETSAATGAAGASA